MKIQTISLWQPWASLWAHGEKKIETRSWPYRGRLPVVLAVHAAKKWGSEQSALCRREPFMSALLACECRLPTPGGFIDPGIPLGAVVGLVRLVECRSTGTGNWDDAWVAALSSQECAFGDYSPGRFCWIADRFRALPSPLPTRGFQAVWGWEAPADVVDMAAALLESQDIAI